MCLLTPNHDLKISTLALPHLVELEKHEFEVQPVANESVIKKNKKKSRQIMKHL